MAKTYWWCGTGARICASIEPTGSGACAALGAGILADDEVRNASTNRNFHGRMGGELRAGLSRLPAHRGCVGFTGRITVPRELLV